MANEEVYFSQDKMEVFSKTRCEMYPLTDWEVSLLLSLIRYSEWETRWIDGVPKADIERLINVLVSNPCEAMVKTNALLVAAIAGLELDLSDDGASLQSFLSGNYNFTVTGIGPKLVTDGDKPLADRLATQAEDSIFSALEQLDNEQLKGVLEQILLILGGTLA